MFWTGFTSINVLIQSFFVFMHGFWLFNIDELLSINPSANVFVFGDFNVHHKD